MKNQIKKLLADTKERMQLLRDHKTELKDKTDLPWKYHRLGELEAKIMEVEMFCSKLEQILLEGK